MGQNSSQIFSLLLNCSSDSAAATFMEPNKDTEAAGSFPSFPSQRPLRVAPLHNDTIPDRFRSLQDTAFLPLLWRVRAGVWRGQYSWKCQLSMVPLYITLAVITTEPTIQALGRLSPVKTAVAQTICEEELALLSWDTIHLLISTALGSRWLPCIFTSLLDRGCPLQLCKTTSFAWDRDENPTDPPFWMQWYMDMARDPGKHSSHLSIPCHPVCSHIHAKCMILISQMLPPERATLAGVAQTSWTKSACICGAVECT